ncbi:hypothetical protein Trco_006108 [Trichoderma cornu-damae]|uniref:Uncharacterized protein n=1 Tax=Trichoderma cornu-damae TaxID=654480 RepID=A0A9P8QKA9_9HYPO|nr:hypothetical protein Trco_006108 [Trichoderma cornu-damae]
MDQSRGWGAASLSVVVCCADCPDAAVDASEMDEAEEVRSAGSRGAFWATGAYIGIARRAMDRAPKIMPPDPGRQAGQPLGVLGARGGTRGQALAQLDGLDGLLQVGDGEDGVGERGDEVVGADPGGPVGVGQLAGLEQGKVLVQDMDGGAALLDLLKRLVEDGSVSAGARVHLVERVDGFAANGQQADDGGRDAQLLEDGHWGHRRGGRGHGDLTGCNALTPLAMPQALSVCTL